MAVFEFRGIQIASGKPVKGFRDADNRTLRALLRREGVLLTLATEESNRRPRRAENIDLLAFMKRPRTSDVAIMTRQLATLVRAGVPLVESIAALTEQVENDQLKRILTTVRESLNEGTSFAKSLEAHPEGVSAALREHDRGGRSVRYARGGARAPRRLHGGAIRN